MTGTYWYWDAFPVVHAPRTQTFKLPFKPTHKLINVLSGPFDYKNFAARCPTDNDHRIPPLRDPLLLPSGS